MQPVDSKFDGECKEWERKLMEASENDPLSVWDGYIRWAHQNSKSNPSHLNGLLLRCTREFQCDDRYKGDPRYLRIWIKYIDTADKPLELFNHLERNGIGSELALFYTSWSLVLELKKAAYPEAYSKLEEGIKRRARPTEQLQNALKQFEQRMSKRTMDALRNAALQPADQNQKSDQTNSSVLLSMVEQKDLKSTAFGRTASAGNNAGRPQQPLEFSAPVSDKPLQGQTFCKLVPHVYSHVV